MGSIGWDIGGAHLKLARLDARGAIRDVAQLACPLWRGLDRLEAVLEGIGAEIDLAAHRHAVTMTGELADLFPDRRRGVRALLATFRKRVGAAPLSVYTLRGLRSMQMARARPLEVASANWHATATLIARQVNDALLIDIGSTTTDLIAVRGGRVRPRQTSDGERLAAGTLLYTGVVRTPVMAVVREVPFAGEWQALAAEHFATLADVYRLTGDLPLRYDRMETADGAGKTAQDSARRLARMLGRDADETDLDGWRRLAACVARRHQEEILRAVERVLSALPAQRPVRIVGAGVGRFIARAVARRLECPYTDFADLVQSPRKLRDMAAVCAPAVAVAKLALARK